MKAREIIKLLEDDGWMFVRSKGSHRVYRHATKAGRVVVAFHAGEIATGTAPAILKQAGLTEKGEK
ncbi:MAG: type II toxin-antitoxin system HicA family toxin [Candidatus Binataceae bacterium]